MRLFGIRNDHAMDWHRADANRLEKKKKGKSPNLRHVSTTHRAALDWLSDRIKVDTEMQISYVDSMNQLADIFD